ncbi:Asp-tRNA(Asn)/Glu-tRNA(Gln) amidotransferase A subunit family amidase [Arthrobacter sp. V4I6]|uniref:hypothetical protein n=1 Tax=unclassified Arthrobacter TaxID=235627 RepID=UPI00277FCEAF|nr:MULTISPECIES: hypothetical protein [unclassified Arthrobacter]MDQ0819436.1 Asp-tRNA(Asn)/Glu-tRNA(Gln) amidotransferase A subunit family amidase [Arthrobacter sp. V1I7]MDQ0853620.1 Asp-tRNA(Asn)/Glu-tRNA(Gln) amidotransferase A subunit family amidase [Arthrobacter sp. V4I6]
MNRRELADVKGTNPELPPGAGPRRKPSFRRALGWVLVACLGFLLFTACSAAPELDKGTAGKFQTRVAAAKQLTAQQNFPAAVTELQQLGQDVTTAAEQGLMSQERKTRIEAAISKVRADVEAAMTPAEPQPVPPAPATEPPAGNDGKQQEEDAKKEAEKQQEEEEEKNKDEKEKDRDND